uniref:Uncharacterized protein n=1 Tax=Glossina austeni TaxID=7395 RepID=A0A1A9V9Y6_GLOAU
MLGLVYLILILGWILIVLFLKCKKSITPHMGLTESYTDTMADHRRPSIHIIQLPHGELEREDRLIEPTQCESTSSRWHSQRLHLTAADERSIVRTYPTDAIINPAYTHDEEYVINGEAPPPSYDEVMRQPEIYPKVHQPSKSSEANI